MPSNVIPDSVAYLLDRPVLAHMATAGPNGTPQNNPVWFVYEAGRFTVAIDPAGQKMRNLERVPYASFSMADPDEPLHYLELRGAVVEIETVRSDHPVVLTMVRKYTGNDTYPGMPEEHTLFVFEPTRCTTMG